MKLRLTGVESARYDQVLGGLRTVYDGQAASRDVSVKQNWKLDERDAFIDRMRAAGVRTVLEVGAGTGQDSAYFQQHDFTVTATDLSPAMVERIRAKGVPAYARDVLHLDLPAAAFDAVYSFNALLHVPNAAIADALLAVRDVLKPGGLFFLGVFGGDTEEGVAAADGRFFAFRSDQEILGYVAGLFEVLDFHVFDDSNVRFQSLTLVKPL